MGGEVGNPHLRRRGKRIGGGRGATLRSRALGGIQGKEKKLARWGDRQTVNINVVKNKKNNTP